MVKLKKPAHLNNQNTFENLSISSPATRNTHIYPACDVQNGVYNTLEGESIYLRVVTHQRIKPMKPVLYQCSARHS